MPRRRLASRSLTWMPAGTTTGVVLHGRQPEREVGAGHGRRERLDADQVQEVHVQPVGHLVDPVQHHLAHPGEQLDQRDAGVGQVVVGPLRGVAGDQPLRLVDDVLEGAVVEVRAGSAITPSSCGIT